jgi:hypothetical protein
MHRDGRIKWTDEQKQRLLRLRDRHNFGWNEIEAALGIDHAKCRQMHRYIHAQRGTKVYHPAEHRQINVPNKNLIDRERRLAALSNASLTALTFGDPPPGFSALDRRRASV